MTRRIFWQTPTLRNDEELKHDRRVTWLELFFDLFIVVVVAEFAHDLAENISWLGVGTFIFLFLLRLVCLVHSGVTVASVID